LRRSLRWLLILFAVVSALVIVIAGVSLNYARDIDDHCIAAGNRSGVSSGVYVERRFVWSSWPPGWDCRYRQGGVTKNTRVSPL
jgi:hypothetical protein